MIKKIQNIQSNRGRPTQAGEMNILGIVILFLVCLFILWVYVGGPQKPPQKPFINPYNDSNAPLKTYGPGETH